MNNNKLLEAKSSLLHLRRKCVIAGTVTVLAVSSCANKESKISVFSENASPNIVDTSKHSELKKVTRRKVASKDTDSTSVDTIIVDCYRWDHEYNASTKMKSEEDGTHFDLNVLITLQESFTSDYYGGMVLYVDEENFVEASIRGHAEGNHITIYYNEDEENTTGELFKDGDKLVQFELSDGEYTASWYSPMHSFVDDTTVISIR